MLRSGSLWFKRRVSFFTVCTVMRDRGAEGGQSNITELNLSPMPSATSTIECPNSPVFLSGGFRMRAGWRLFLAD